MPSIGCPRKADTRATRFVAHWPHPLFGNHLAREGRLARASAPLFGGRPVVNVSGRSPAGSIVIRPAKPRDMIYRHCDCRPGGADKLQLRRADCQRDQREWFVVFEKKSIGTA
jgi:hypothetical protein